MDDERLDRLAALIATSPHNLVSRGERERVADVHVPEAVALIPELALESGQRWLDLGTGGGLPGLALAVAVPEVRWVLLDSVRKKVEAVRAFAAELGLGNVEAVAGRAEEAAHDPQWRGSFDGVVSRAVAALPTLLELARGFVAPAGRLVAVKGPSWEEELAAARGAMQALRWGSPQVTHLTSAVRPTWLVSMRAEGQPPPGFPRRTGLPRQAPLR